MRKRDFTAFLIIIGVTLLFLFILFSVFHGSSKMEGLSISGGEKVALLEVKGMIFDAKSFVEDLRRYLKISSVKAIVVRVDSPGGGVAASQEMYAELRKAREKLPVVVSMGGVAASGGYYLALAADTIMANPGTTTGSIGVIAGVTLIHRLAEKIGVDYEVIKSGKFKDTGNSFRKITPEERKYLQELIDDVYEQFIEVVAVERGLPLNEVRKMADGRVFTGRQAMEMNLVDLLGNYQDAITLAGELGGIEGTPEVLEKKKRKLTLWDILFGDFEEALHRLDLNRTEVRYQMP